MKYLAILTLLGLAALVLSGCSGMWANSTYGPLLDRTTVAATQTASDADSGKLTPAQMQQALDDEAAALQNFDNAKNGTK